MVLNFVKFGESVLVTCSPSSSPSSDVYSEAIITFADFGYPFRYHFQNFKLNPPRFRYFCSYLIGLSREKLLSRCCSSDCSDEDDLIFNFDFE